MSNSMHANPLSCRLPRFVKFLGHRNSVVLKVNPKKIEFVIRASVKILYKAASVLTTVP